MVRALNNPELREKLPKRVNLFRENQRKIRNRSKQAESKGFLERSFRHQPIIWTIIKIIATSGERCSSLLEGCRQDLVGCGNPYYQRVFSVREELSRKNFTSLQATSKSFRGAGIASALLTLLRPAHCTFIDKALRMGVSTRRSRIYDSPHFD